MKIKNYELNMKQVGVTAAKIVVGTVAAAGAGLIISRYGKQAICPDDKLIKKGLILFGASILSGVVGNVAEKYVGEQIDSCVDTVDEMIKKCKNKNNDPIVVSEEVEEEEEDV